mmetsp:Transcript_10269/g.28690  ORF Transcript_10269/g.28690 Transcript_10269/m.28690 type:complete len:270 (+) Transcript_10269:548-1357(+)
MHGQDLLQALVRPPHLELLLGRRGGRHARRHVREARLRGRLAVAAPLLRVHLHGRGDEGRRVPDVALSREVGDDLRSPRGVAPLELRDRTIIEELPHAGVRREGLLQPIRLPAHMWEGVQRLAHERRHILHITLGSDFLYDFDGSFRVRTPQPLERELVQGALDVRALRERHVHLSGALGACIAARASAPVRVPRQRPRDEGRGVPDVALQRHVLDDLHSSRGVCVPESADRLLVQSSLDLWMLLQHCIDIGLAAPLLRVVTQGTRHEG